MDTTIMDTNCVNETNLVSVRRRRNRSGTTLIEYMLFAAMAALVILGSIANLGEAVSDRWVFVAESVATAN